jgi:signal transduction histidine kinase
MRSITDVRILQNPPWWTTAHIAITFGVASAISVLAATIIAWLARQRLHTQALRRQMAEAEFSAMLTERNRIAREIHDTLAQGLGAISMHLEMVKDQLKPVPDKVAKHLDIAHQTARQSLAEARESIWNMRSQVLENGDLATALQAILHSLTDGTPIVGEFTVIGDARRLLPAVENNLLRIGQETFTNALKHAHAKQVSATLTFGDQQVTLKVCDNGCGFDPTLVATESHFGLRGLRERTAQMGGNLEIRSSPGAGTEISIQIPVLH